MIINIRGTSGAGKSTLVTKIMELYPQKFANHEPGRKRPVSYLLYAAEGPLRSELVVLGHYEIACGGCDTLKTLDDVYGRVRRYAHNRNVLFEGIMVGEDVTRAVALSKDFPDFAIIELSTPIEECLARVRARRAAKGNEKPLNEKATRAKHKGYANRRARLKDAGVNYLVMDCDAAFIKVKELLKL